MISIIQELFVLLIEFILFYLQYIINISLDKKSDKIGKNSLFLC